MSRIDFFLSNDGHHVTMFRPVVQGLLETTSPPGVRILSLCELRGLRTPADLSLSGGTVARIMPFLLRRSSGAVRVGGDVQARRRSVLRGLVWSVFLKRRLESLLEDRPDLAVLPNDSAFPYDLICEVLNRRAIPFVLVQEGIRFPMPNAEGDRYGRSGAAAIAAWGKNSADFFRSQGVQEEQIVVTGNPRYDAVVTADWSEDARHLRRETPLGERVLLVLTNPIDAQGFCSEQEKLELVVEFLRRIVPLFGDPEFSVVVKIHGGESWSRYHEAVQRTALPDRIHIVQRGGLYPLLELADAAVVLASTVGLEALMFDCPLGVLEIPGHGYVHDYVEAGAAVGLAWEGDLAGSVERLLDEDPARKEGADRYVRENLAFLGSSSERIVELLVNRLGPVGACA